MIATLDPLVSESRVAKILSFAKMPVGCGLPRIPDSQIWIAKVGLFARIFATLLSSKNEDRLRACLYH